jgi:hypothetical protein
MAVVAGLLAGCQTAQKQDSYGNVDFDAMFPGYGSDRESTRSPASAEPLFEMVLKELAKVKIAKISGGSTEVATKDFLRFINKSKGPEVSRVKNEVFAELDAAARKEKGWKRAEDVKLDETTIKRVSESAQIEISGAYLRQKSMMDLPQLNALRDNVEKARFVAAGFDAKDFREAQNAKLLKDNTVQPGKQGFSEQTTRTVQQNSQNIIDGQIKAGKLNASFNTLEKVLTEAARENGDAGAKEVRKLIEDMKIAAGRVWQATGDSHLIPETCENLDVETLKSYTQLLRDIRKEFDSYPKAENGRVKCSNIADITAWVAAKFQQSLGRRGVSAWTAVQEMTFCNYLKTDVATASRKMASINGGDVPEKVECKQ